ncbi:MAG: BatD family protein [Deltaproteobacteria bacterium]|nr:BatD family protein [Deltaproteobacteria bacterium]
MTVSRSAPSVVVVVVACLFSFMARAQDDLGEGALGLRMQVKNGVLKSGVKQGETFQLDVILTVRGQDSVDELEMPDVTDFSVVSEQESSNASFFVKNGRRSVVVEHRRTLVLRADEPGKKEIGEATAKLGESTARAAPLRIRVIADPQAAPVDPTDVVDVSDKQESADAGVDAKEVRLPGARFGSSLPSVFLEVTADKESVVVGEQLTVTVEIWSQGPLGSYPRVPPQKPAGFLCLPIDDGTRLQAVQRSLGGRSWYVYPVTRDALFALAPGKKTLPTLEVQVSPAGSFFSRGQDVRVRSGTTVVDVKPLPDGAPEGFAAGSVGRFSLAVSARPRQVKVGEPFTLVVEATGFGNIDHLTLPVWSGDDRVRLFPPAERRERKDRDGVVAGRVVQETLVQPLDKGDIVVPPLSLVAYSPADGRYLTSTSTPLTVRVLAGAAGATTKTRARALLTAGPRPLVLDAPLRDDVIGNEIVFLGAGLGALLSVAGALVGFRRRQQDTAGARRRQRLEQRARDLKSTRELAATARLLLDAASDRAGDDVRSTPLAALPAMLVSRGVPAGLAQRAADALLVAEAARYSPGGQQQQARDDVVAAALALDALGVG